MPQKNDLKVEGNKVWWFNGVKWLIKETLSTEKKSEEKLLELKTQHVDKQIK